MLGELEANGRIVVFDMEAGLGTLLRLAPGQADVVLVVTEPSVKAIEVARRAAEAAADRARVVVVANRVRDRPDLDAIRSALGAFELVALPEEPAITEADERGAAPIDVNPSAEAVRALVELAGRLAEDAPDPGGTAARR